MKNQKTLLCVENYIGTHARRKNYKIQNENKQHQENNIYLNNKSENTHIHVYNKNFSFCRYLTFAVLVIKYCQANKYK